MRDGLAEAVWFRLSGLWRGRAREAEMAEEMGAHLDRLTAAIRQRHVARHRPAVSAASGSVTSPASGARPMNGVFAGSPTQCRIYATRRDQLRRNQASRSPQS